MSCNPSFGGIGKGHLMREIDALDGLCAKICDKSAIQFRVLNRSKGPAVWGIRAQIDRDMYKKNMQDVVSSTPGLEMMEDSVEDIMLQPSSSCQRVAGVHLASGKSLKCKAVVITTGTFLNGKIYIGTPPRIDERTVDFRYLERQFGDKPPIPFSFLNLKDGFQCERQVPCFLTQTNAATHKIVADNLHLNRHILEEVTGPRSDSVTGIFYCISL
ncbi:Protein MTO1 homolog, mitochondrial [Geodia barretti]|uniref:Protein MTO1 homolog, mitochondrial n=1 Tax=Geodia barretti TaxID=519541 RepID=A0AA35SP73_GEOBA|nr:Protein MTO1 homolog, mitochondrial [Geodia barretti]